MVTKPSAKKRVIWKIIGVKKPWVDFIYMIDFDTPDKANKSRLEFLHPKRFEVVKFISEK